MSDENPKESVQDKQEETATVAAAQQVESVVGEIPAEEAEGEVEAEPDKELTLEERLEAAETKAIEYLDGWQRARAEFANAKKRLEKDRHEAHRRATVAVMSKLLPVIDDFDRALETVPSSIAEDSWFEGVALAHRKLRTILDGAKIERIEAVGQPFDPVYHEAVLQEPSDEYESGIVIKELQSGYKLEDRVIRPAMVIVAA